MLIDPELKKLLENGKTKTCIHLPIEVGLVTRDKENHLVAFVGGTPVFHSIYSPSASTLQVQAAVDYIKKKLMERCF